MSDTRTSWQRNGYFTSPSNAAAAARKNHALGTAHRFTSQTAREAVQKREDRRQGEVRDAHKRV